MTEQQNLIEVPPEVAVAAMEKALLHTQRQRDAAEREAHLWREMYEHEKRNAEYAIGALHEQLAANDTDKAVA